MFFGGVGTSFQVPKRKYENLTNPIIVTKHSSKQKVVVLGVPTPIV